MIDFQTHLVDLLNKPIVRVIFYLHLYISTTLFTNTRKKIISNLLRTQKPIESWGFICRTRSSVRVSDGNPDAKSPHFQPPNTNQTYMDLLTIHSFGSLQWSVLVCAFVCVFIGCYLSCNKLFCTHKSGCGNTSAGLPGRPSTKNPEENQHCTFLRGERRPKKDLQPHRSKENTGNIDWV